jgi:glutaredoxin
MITVYGADWCEDTQRSLRHLRRLTIAHEYVNIDEDSQALERAKALNRGMRRTPTIDLGVGGDALVEPDNDTLSAALVEIQMLTQEDLHERLALQNVGDVERAVRTGLGAALVLLAGSAPRGLKWPARLAGFVLAASGVSGWCPVFHAAGVSSLDGPGDRPGEAERDTWLIPVRPTGDTHTPALQG